MKTLAHFCALGFGMLLASTASAIPIPLILDNDGDPSFQQTANSPCVIGNPSCSNPGGFGYTNINPVDNDGTVTLAESLSPVYSVAQITAIVGTAFNIGVDTNQAGNHKDPANWLQLQEFDVLVNGNIEFQYVVGPPGTSIKLINGNGYSDATLSAVLLSGFLGTDQVTFQTLYNNATNGPESFFIYSTTAQPCNPNCPPEGVPEGVPEPGTLLLLGSALAALGGFARRKARTGVRT